VAPFLFQARSCGIFGIQNGTLIVVILTIFHTHFLIDYPRYVLLAIDGAVKYNALSLGVRKLTEVLLVLIGIGTDPRAHAA
jgi:hypothetical protein